VAGTIAATLSLDRRGYVASLSGSRLPFQLVNNYGPTECTVVATSGRVLPGEGMNSLPTIGLPIANTTVYILDENLQPVAPGKSGELYIGGAGVARGYLNRPDITAERFICDPSVQNQALVFNKTEISHLGYRMDNSVSGPHRRSNQNPRLPN